MESPSANLCEERCTSAKQSISEPPTLGMAKNVMDGVHMCAHASTHPYKQISIYIVIFNFHYIFKQIHQFF